jgi:hypothetical protein
MEFEEFKNLVKRGVEYNFDIENTEYWISHNNEGYYLTRVKDAYTQSFKTSEELFEKSKIGNHSLEKLWPQIKKYCS